MQLLIVEIEFERFKAEVSFQLAIFRVRVLKTEREGISSAGSVAGMRDHIEVFTASIRVLVRCTFRELQRTIALFERQ